MTDNAAAPTPGDAGDREPWPGAVITLMHYAPRSRGARVIVTVYGRHIVSSASYEGMTVDDPNIQNFLTWARHYYHGAEFREICRAIEDRADDAGE